MDNLHNVEAYIFSSILKFIWRRKGTICSLYMPCFSSIHVQYTLEKIKTKLMGIFEYLFIYRILTVTCHNIFAEMSSILGTWISYFNSTYQDLWIIFTITHKYNIIHVQWGQYSQELHSRDDINRKGCQLYTCTTW